MSIAGPLYRRTPRLFSARNKPGDWTLVWCELLETGEFVVYAHLPPAVANNHKNHSNDSASGSGSDGEAAATMTATPQRRLLTISVAECGIAHVRSDGRDCIELTPTTAPRQTANSSSGTGSSGGRKETFSSHESSYDVDWWMSSLLAVQRDLAHGVRPKLSIVCPPSGSKAAPRARSMRRAPSAMAASGTRAVLRRRQPTLTAAVTRFERYTIYETGTTYYVVCSDRHYSHFRLFTLDRTVERPTSLPAVLTEDPELYTWAAMEDKLQDFAAMATNAGHKLIRAFTAVAIVGCIRFLRGYYFIFVTQRRKIGCIGGNFIYGISATQQLNVSTPSPDGSAWTWISRWFNPSPEEEAEARYLGLFHFIDLTKDFFYSYSYDVTHTLQHNMTTEKSEPAEMFTWNEYLTRELKSCLSAGAVEDLIVPLVLGCYEQRKCSVFGRLVSITLLARRSRHFAGTRYLKRGVADTGKAANDVETEQIIEDENMGAGKFSSFVQYRGSIPVFWSQETSATLPKPPIVLNRVDPTYTASRKHFADLFSRYGSPIVSLNLVKQSEKKEREVIVGNEFMNAVEYLNSFIPHEHRIRYVALDYSRLSKQKGLNVLHSLDKVAVWALTQTGFFCSAPKRQIGRSTSKKNAYVSFALLSRGLSAKGQTGKDCDQSGTDDENSNHPPASPTIPRKSGDWLEQKGVLRTNCIDCLDRTNVSQFSVGMRALGQQLYAMGIRNTPLLESRSQLVRVLMLLYSLVGDAISMQYGGSEAHKNVKNSAGRENVKHRELLTSIRRYYSNSFTDMAKQDAINIFLGHFVPRDGDPPLWELDSDYYLHNFEVRNGVTACDSVRQTLEMQAESKQQALRSVPSSGRILTSPPTAEEVAARFERHEDGEKSMSTEEKRRREAYVQECKRLLEDWWKEPLETFEIPKYCLARERAKRRPTMERLNSGKRCASDGDLVSQARMSSDSVEFGQTRTRKSISGASDTFLQMYHPEELTSFDKTLGYKFMSPMDLSNESTSEDRATRSRVSSSVVNDTIPENGIVASARSSSTDENFLEASVPPRRVSGRSSIATRGIRSMSAPDIGDDLDRRDSSVGRTRELGVKMLRPDDEDHPLAEPHIQPRVAFGFDSRSGKPLGAIRGAPNIQNPYSNAVKRKDEQLNIEEYVQSRGHAGHKKFVGDCATPTPDSVYERYVHWNRPPTTWETESESVKMFFESYLRDNSISVDDAKALRDAQVRAGATFRIQTGPYAGLDQNVKARVLVAKKLRTEPEDRRVYEESMDYKRLMAADKTAIPAESLDLYKSFFDEPLPDIPIFPDAPRTTVIDEASTIAASVKLAHELRKSTIANRRGPQGSVGGRNSRLGDHTLISVGPLFKLDGGKDQDFILFNESAAENLFADVIKNETELSFYTK